MRTLPGLPALTPALPPRLRPLPGPAPQDNDKEGKATDMLLNYETVKLVGPSAVQRRPVEALRALQAWGMVP